MASSPSSRVSAVRMIGKRGTTTLVRAGSITRTSQWNALPFIRSHVTTETLCVLIGTWLATLIGRQEIAVRVPTAAGVARVNRRAFKRNSHGLSWSAVVLQLPEFGVSVVPIAAVMEVAGVIAAHVVALRGHRARAVSSTDIVRDNAVLKGRAAMEARADIDPAAHGVVVGAISADGAVVDCCRAARKNAAATCV